MISLLIFVFACIHLGLLTYLWRQPRLSGQWRVWFLSALLTGMAFDNLIVASGVWFIEQPWFAIANVPRFYLHVLILPFLSLFTYSLIAQSKLALGQNKAFFVVCLLITLATLGYGISHELMDLQLSQKSALGITRFSNSNSSAPLATIFTNLFTLLLAGYIWRKLGWKILFFGGLFIFVVNGAAASQEWGFIAGNFAEIIFVLSLLKTHLHFSTSDLLTKRNQAA